jgi:hypothetical protein
VLELKVDLDAAPCRDANDDARLLDGKALLRYVTDYRVKQIEEKKARQEKLKQVRGVPVWACVRGLSLGTGALHFAS